MAKSTESDDRGGFDLQKFRRLLQLMEKFGVTEASLSREGESWKVRRGPRQVAVAPDQLAWPQPTAAAPPPTASSSPAEATSGGQAPAPASAGTTIDAPTVGTFYSSSSPDDDPFVTVGSVVKADTVVCIIEAMKVFNQIPAEKSGRIAEILVENGDAVEYGQPLFRLEPA